MKNAGKGVCRAAVGRVMTAGAAPQDAAPDGTAAVGAIFVNDAQELPENEKVYAAFADNSYAFALDAAYVYFFSAGAEVAYAGDENFVSMTFGADLDGDTVGAEGVIAYAREEHGENTVAGYFLYHDGEGVYFDTGACFARTEITDGCVMTGTDFPCRAVFEIRRPAASLVMVCYDENREEISRTAYAPGELEDYQTFEMDGGVAAVEMIACDADGGALETTTLTPEDRSAVICFDGGGQILASRYLRLAWPE